MVSERIKTRRKELRLKQTDLAALVGVSIDSIRRLESGTRIPRSAELIKLAKALQTTPSYLIGETDEIFPTVGDISTTMLGDIIDYKHSVGSIICVPVFHRAYSACCGDGFPNPEYIYAEADEFIDMPAAFIGAVSKDEQRRPFMIYAEGDSMEGAGISDGDQLLINPAAEIYDGDSALLEYGQNRNVVVKRVYWLNDCSVEIRSACGDNWSRAFTRKELNDGLIRIIGKVVWYGNRPKRG